MVNCAICGKKMLVREQRAFTKHVNSGTRSGSRLNTLIKGYPSHVECMMEHFEDSSEFLEHVAVRDVTVLKSKEKCVYGMRKMLEFTGDDIDSPLGQIIQRDEARIERMRFLTQEHIKYDIAYFAPPDNVIVGPWANSLEESQPCN